MIIKTKELLLDCDKVTSIVLDKTERKSIRRPIINEIQQEKATVKITYVQEKKEQREVLSWSGDGAIKRASEFFEEVSKQVLEKQDDHFINNLLNRDILKEPK